MTTVNGVSGSGQQTLTDSLKKTLGKDDFLKLLVTQLQYQDPLEPTNNQDFIAQMAQFSSLEQMTNMTGALDKLAGMQESTLRELAVGQAVNMIGRTVSVVVPTETLTGKINTDTTLYARADKSSAVVGDLTNNMAVTLLGREGEMLKVKLADGTNGYVDEAACTLDAAPRVVGVVTAMKIVDGAPYVTVNGTDLPISQIAEVNLTNP